MLAVVSLWPLICLKSPKQQTAEARFYCPSMRKGDRATSAWWMGSNWESKGWDKGVVSRHKTLLLPAFTYTETLLFKCIHVWVCVVWITGKLCYQRDSYIPDSLWELDIKQYCTEKLSRMCDSFPFSFSPTVEWIDHVRQRAELWDLLYTVEPDDLLKPVLRW